MTALCSSVGDRQIVPGIAFTSRLASAYQRRT
jgi:hypothetical protein